MDKWQGQVSMWEVDNTDEEQDKEEKKMKKK